MKQQYYHFEKPKQYPKFVYQLMDEINKLKKASGVELSKEVYDKTLAVAVYMQMIDNNEKINEELNVDNTK